MLPSWQVTDAPALLYRVLIGRAPEFANGGWSSGPLLALSPLLVLFGAELLWRSKPEPKRDVSDLFGSARFASVAERTRLRSGLELGRDPDTGWPVRVAVQGTLVTIAPPRKGKTSGLLIPNLAFPEPQGWGGPAVVLDPKGEVYRAVAARRRALGRRVVCLDPLGLAGGTDRWNPLHGRDPEDVLYLQSTALALLPEASGDSEASAYFRNRAVDLIVGAMLVALRLPADRSVVQVQDLIVNEGRLLGLLKQYVERWPEPAAYAAMEILEADPKTKDPIKSTALQAFQWLADRRLRDLVGASTFELADLSSGTVDLFVAVPTEYKAVLAPLLRWLLSDLFTAVRRNRPVERLVVFIDEAAVLGRFDALLTAAGELPGYGASLWTMWQDRAQLVGLYGEAGADVLLNTAEVVTVFDVPAVDPDESERWSRAIGDYTTFVESRTAPSGEAKGSPSTTRTSQGARLMSKEALIAMPGDELLVFPNSGGHARHPLRLKKTVAHTDPRFRKLIAPVAPVGRAR
ncbi:type IV secretory system conjugative DNA transfer family protein [Methylorubrum suomiense]|uniref:Protein VirD4 n=1 Tax=Methylorubrum suomiense TaxID=144191 RepID=A0ABQ4V342_9HYPH|nr:type IV secretory system conjugative DNA transfer family protein [Methylorubrum suomiense]GJE78454.1 Protein VirD4 [Methylorubrum suomiense]